MNSNSVFPWSPMYALDQWVLDPIDPRTSLIQFWILMIYQCSTPNIIALTLLVLKIFKYLINFTLLFDIHLIGHQDIEWQDNNITVTITLTIDNLRVVFPRNIYNIIVPFQNCLKCYMQVLSQLQQLFWIPSALHFVKRILMKCVICRKVSGTHYSAPYPSPLPKVRLPEG
jgi:hypothetical protein